jgi:DNA-directed RNA polymerase beta subunit
MASSKFYSKLAGNRADPAIAENPQLRRTAVLTILGGMKLDPSVMRRNLGQPVDSLSPGVLHSVTNKLLAISRDEATPDDRDSLVNKMFLGPEHLAYERIVRDTGRLGKQMLWKSGRERNLQWASPGFFTPQLEGLLIGNSLSQLTAAINPVDIHDQLHRIVQTGEGGIGDAHMIPTSSRNIHPTHAFFIDPIRSSEGMMIGTDLRIANNTKLGSDRQIYSPFTNRKTGKVEYLNPEQIQGHVVGFPEAPTVSNLSQPLPGEISPN